MFCTKRFVYTDWTERLSDNQIFRITKVPFSMDAPLVLVAILNGIAANKYLTDTAPGSD